MLEATELRKAECCNKSKAVGNRGHYGSRDKGLKPPSNQLEIANLPQKASQVKCRQSDSGQKTQQKPLQLSWQSTRSVSGRSWARFPQEALADCTSTTLVRSSPTGKLRRGFVCLLFVCLFVRSFVRSYGSYGLFGLYCLYCLLPLLSLTAITHGTHRTLSLSLSLSLLTCEVRRHRAPLV